MHWIAPEEQTSEKHFRDKWRVVVISECEEFLSC